jgi:uncharacterized protein (UPF0212 family)
MKCPKCDEECDVDEVDVGVGIIYGPPKCPNCGWSADDMLMKEMTTTVKLEYPMQGNDQLGECES